MPRKPKKILKPRPDFHPWELVFLAGEKEEGLNKWQKMGLHDLQIGHRARLGDKTPEELRAAWREATGKEPFAWEEI